MAFNQVAVLGPGLLGGSIGLAIQERGLGTVRFWGRSEEKLAVVRDAGFFARGNLAEVLEGVDLVVLATPVPFFAGLARQLVELGGEFVVTDVGSVKGSVEEGAGKLLREAGISFVGSHPMAGSEQGGFEAAKGKLFEGATCFVCPSESEERASVEDLQKFWESLGCCVREIGAAKHDQVVARISHLPHALAAVAARVSLRNEGEGSLGGGGLVDTTRVAAGNAEMWTGILLENQTAVLDELERAAQEVATLRELLLSENAEGVLTWLDDAKRLRDQLK
ncbi:MAG: prephenate dehydrogenase [Roseibacillus sp.]